MDSVTPMDVGERDVFRDSAQRAQDSQSRHSPAPPLAPLEYLQNQRRGSITDPSLHAASPNPQNPPITSVNASAPSTQFRQQDFPHPDRGIAGNAMGSSHNAQESAAELSQSQNGQTGKRKGLQPMETDAPERPPVYKPAIDVASPSEPPNFDYNMRRHSIPGGEINRSVNQGGAGQSRASPISPASQAGAKRKMSSDRGVLPAVGEEIDPQLVGPGAHLSLTADPDEPAPKRRSSAFDTRIGQLSLYDRDRRETPESRMSGAPNWWGGERRDSSSSTFSGTSMPSSVGGFNSPAFSGEAQGRQTGNMSAFAWPPTGGPGDPSPQPGLQGEVAPNIGRPFEGQPPPAGMPFDRRMSVPDTMPSSSTSRPERVLRSRSRPPSRTAAAARQSEASSGKSEGAAPPQDNKDEDSPSSASPSGGPSSSMKDSGNTPYSRSPELRVSHKLAERKRRKEMRDLFDELRDHLPADRGMKASKWEILSKAIDFIGQMKQSHQDMAREVEMLRHELDSVRHSVPAPFGHGVVYNHGPPVTAQYPPPGGPHPPQPQQSLSRPGSSHNSFVPSSGAGPTPTANGKPPQAPL